MLELGAGPPGDESLSAGAIVGIVFGCIVGVAFILVLLVLLKRYSDHKKYNHFDESHGIAWDNPNYMSDTVQLDDQPKSSESSY